MKGLAMNNANPLSLDFLLQKPGKAAGVIQTLDAEQAALYLSHIPVRAIAPVIERIESWPAARIIEHMPLEKTSAVLGQIKYPAAAAIMRVLNEEKRKALLTNLPSQLVRSLNRSISYSEDTVGAWMDSSALHFSRDLSVGDCLALLKKSERPVEVIIAVDENHHVDGIVPLSALLISDSKHTLRNISDRHCVPIAGRASVVMAKDAADWQRYNTLPVRAANGVFLGTISRQALFSALDKSSTGIGEPLGNSMLSHLIRAMMSSAIGLLAMLAHDFKSVAKTQEKDHDFNNGK